MSDKKLDGVYNTLRWNSIFMDAFTLLGFLYISISQGAVSFPILLILLVIGGFPVLKGVFFGGLMSALTAPLKADYEVVTYRNGVAVSSDGGTESMQMNFLSRLVQIGIALVIAPVAVFIHVCYLSIKGLGLHFKARPKPTFIKSVPAIILFNIAVYIVSVALLFGVALGRIAARDAALDNLAGRTLTVFTSELNLRAEPSGTGRVIKTLKENDTLTATGNIVGFWVPVESGSDKGYAFATSLNLDDTKISRVVEFPFLASAADTITVMSNDSAMNEAFTLERGAEVTVTLESMDVVSKGCYFTIEYRNAYYRIWNDEREKLNFVRTVPRVTNENTEKRPDEFNRKVPYNATVIEDIEVENFNTAAKFSIPAGATVSVVHLYNVSVRVSYNGQEAIVQWQDLKLTN